MSNDKNAIKFIENVFVRRDLRPRPLSLSVYAETKCLEILRYIPARGRRRSHLQAQCLGPENGKPHIQTKMGTESKRGEPLQMIGVRIPDDAGRRFVD